MTATVDADLVRALAALLTETGLTELEYAKADLRVRVARAPSPVAAPIQIAAAAAPPPSLAMQQPEAAEGTITSPMVGTVYLAGQPGAPQFVQEGERVRKGQTLLIIEAMKVMNPFPAPRDGTVTRFMVRDGQPVEFGEPLLILI